MATRKLSNVELEKEMQDMGISRYRASVKRCVEDQKETQDPAVSWLLTNAVDKVAQGIAQYRIQKPDHEVTTKVFAHFDDEVIALITCQSILDSISTGRKFQTTAGFIGSALEDEARWKILIKGFKLQVKRMQRGRKWKMRSDYTHRRLMLNKCAEDSGLKWDPWPLPLHVTAGTVLIDLMVEYTGLITVDNVRRGCRQHLIIKARPEVSEWIAKARSEHEVMYPIYMPSTTPPSEWTNMHDGGYHTNLVARRPLIKTTDKEHLESAGRSGMSQVLLAINRLQQTPWTINVPVLQAMQAAWDSNLEIGNIPNSVPLEIPPRPTDPNELRIWRGQAHHLHTTNTANQSRRLYIARTMALARKFAGNTFYYPYTCDFRGRVYPQPAFLQPQGPGESRGLIRFAEARPVETQDALNWFLMQGANKFGYDKVSFHDRIKWVEQNADKIIDSATSPIEYRWWWKADSPWEFLAWAIEYKQYKTQRYGFTTAIPVALDGSNNGLQIYSLLMGDRVSGAATNCMASLPSEKPQDIYQDVADIVTKTLETEAQGTDEVRQGLARRWLQFVGGRIPRKATKRPVMTLPYGSTKGACRKSVESWYAEEVLSRGRISQHEVFKDVRYQACNYLADRIWDAIGETVSAARTCMTWLQDVSKVASKQGVPLWWTSPSGFLVKQKYRQYDVQSVQTVVGTRTRRLRLRLDNDNMSARKQRQGIAPNFVHSLDAAALVRTVNLCHERGITDFAMIHDSYGTSADKSTLMAQTLREAYAEMFREPILERFLEEVGSLLPDPSALPPVPPKGDMTPDEVTKSTYFFS